MPSWKKLIDKTVIVGIGGAVFPAKVKDYSETNWSVTLDILDYDGFYITTETYRENQVELLEVLE